MIGQLAITPLRLLGVEQSRIIKVISAKIWGCAPDFSSYNLRSGLLDLVSPLGPSGRGRPWPPFLRIIAGVGVTGGAQASCTLTGRGPCARSRPPTYIYMRGVPGVVLGRVFPRPDVDSVHIGACGEALASAPPRAPPPRPPRLGSSARRLALSLEGPSGSFLRCLPRPRPRAAHLRVRRRRARRWDAG